MPTTSKALAPSGFGTAMAARASLAVKIDCAPPCRRTFGRPVFSSHSMSLRLPNSTRRSHSTIFMSSPGATRATSPGIVPAAVGAVAVVPVAAGASFGAPEAAALVPTVPAIVASTLRTVTGSSGTAPPGSTASRMPKSAGNLASGGSSSVATLSGNDEALASGRPASSLRPAGSSSRNAVRGGRPGPKLTRSMPSPSPLPASFGSFAAYALPAASTRRMRAASRRATGAVNASVSGTSGRHCASRLTRWHENVARNGGRTRKASAWSAVVATGAPWASLAATMPRPQTSLASAPAGSVRAQASVTSGESGASRRRRKRSSSLPEAGSSKASARLRPLSASISSTRRYEAANDLRWSRITRRSSPVTMRTGMRSLMPAATQYAWAAIEAAVAGASRPRMNTWFSSMVLPSYGRLRRTAGPPVENSKRAPPSCALPSTAVSPAFSVNVQRTPAGRSRSKS